jgi:hypothetical protein
MQRSDYEPGEYVRHPGRVTVMFENAGKVVINTDGVTLEREDDPLRGQA